MHRGASTADVARRVARRLLHSHAAAILTPQPRFTLFAPLRHDRPLSVSFLAMLKERYKNNKTTKETPPSHSLSLSLALWGRRWVLASLSRPRARVDLCPPLALTQQQEHEGEQRNQSFCGS